MVHLSKVFTVACTIILTTLVAFFLVYETLQKPKLKDNDALRDLPQIHTLSRYNTDHANSDNDIYHNSNFEPDFDLDSKKKKDLTYNFDPITLKTQARLQNVFVDSTNYDQLTGKLTINFNFKNIISIELYTAAFPKGEYVISILNNTIIYIQNGTRNTIVLSTGDYDAEELASEIQSKIKAIDTTYSCTYSHRTTSINHRSSSASFSLEISSLLLQSNLGLNSTLSSSVDTGGGTHIINGPARVDLLNSRYLLIKSAKLENHYGNTDIIATVDIPNPINFYRGGKEHLQRQFAAPIKSLKTLNLCLETKNPYTNSRPYQTLGLGFHFTLAVRTLVTENDIFSLKNIYT
mgnify:CR=1 FL=1|tara:strand:+ start:12512 stop:13558 length:1047 start_codon:yes stop_codon:yes gene_type:complete